MQGKGLYAGKKPQGQPSEVSKRTGGLLGEVYFPKSSQVVVIVAPDCMCLSSPHPLQMLRTVLGPESIWALV